MNYYSIDLRPRKDPEFCFLNQALPEYFNALYTIRQARSAASTFPDDLSLQMPTLEPGTCLSTLIANTLRLLIVHQSVQEVLEKLDLAPTEFLSFRLLNHKGQLASDEYVLVNVLSTVDCVDMNASIVKYASTGEVLSIKKYVFCSKHLEDQPDLIRVDRDPALHLVSHSFYEAMKPLKPTNFHIYPIEVV